MAACKKSQIENETLENSFKANDIAHFLSSENLDSVSLILLDLMIPFKRQLSAFLSVAEPLSSLLFGQTKIGKILKFSCEENSLEALKEALERGEK